MDAAEPTQEEEYLASTVRFIDRESASIDRHRPSHAATTHTANALELNKDAIIDRYARARERPYFGRVDFHGDDRGMTQAYIGTTFIPGHVFSWTAPYVRQLFYAVPQRVQGYSAPEGFSPGRVTLKRQYAIADARLMDGHGGLPSNASRRA